MHSVVGSVIGSVAQSIVGNSLSNGLVFSPSLNTLIDSFGNTPEANIRNSTATAFDYLGVLKTIPINSHRLNYGRWDGMNWFDDDGAGNPLHPSHTFKGTKRYRSFMPYATAQVVAAGGHRFEGGRYYQTLTGGTTNLTTPLQLSNDGGMLITGNSIKKISGVGGWNAAVSSNNNFTGSAYCEATTHLNNANIMIALSISPKANQSYTSLDYAIYYQVGGNIGIRELGVNIQSNAGAYTIGDRVSILYEGTTIHYQLNGVDIHTTPVSAGLTLALDTSFQDVGGQLDNIIFQPRKTLKISEDIGITDWIDKGIYNAEFGVLVEGGSTNIITDSELSSSIAFNSTVTPAPTNNNAVAPDGTNTYWTYTDGCTGFNQKNYVIPAATTQWTFSRDYKGTSGSINLASLGVFTVDQIGSAILDIATGIVTGADAARVNVAPLKSGGYRISITFTNNGIGTMFLTRETMVATSPFVGVSGGRAQLENSPIESSYIKTSGGVASRANEMGNIKWNSSFFPQAAGTLGLTIKPQFASGDLAAAHRVIAALGSPSTVDILSQAALGFTDIRSYDSTSFVNKALSAWLHTDSLEIFVRWGIGADSTNPAQQRLVLTSRNANKGESFVSLSTVYDGAFSDTGFYQWLASGGLNNITLLNNPIWDKPLTDADLDSLVEL